MRIVGLDEAGRGCVIGPMAVAGVLVDEKGLEALVRMGVRDSKLLSPARREVLCAGIKRVALAHEIVLVQPRQIDEAVARGTLNKLEAKVMASIIDALRPDVAYVDASDVLEARFAVLIRSYMAHGRQVEIVAEHHADAKWPVVSAASILAKVERDRAVEALKEELGVDFGSGYPTDPRTLRFLREWYAEHGSFPDFVRKSWRTIREIVLGLGTASLDTWIGGRPGKKE